jgi:hypothetical protein
MGVGKVDPVKPDPIAGLKWEQRVNSQKMKERVSDQQ